MKRQITGVIFGLLLVAAGGIWFYAMMAGDQHKIFSPAEVLFVGISLLMVVFGAGIFGGNLGKFLEEH